MGFARLGALVNFISHTVVVGFTAGAGLLIIVAQLQNFTGVPVSTGSGASSPACAASHSDLGSIDPWIVADRARHAGNRAGRTPGATRKYRSCWSRWSPGEPVRVRRFSASASRRCRRSARCHAGVPPLSLPSFDPAVWRTLAPATLALTALALAQAVSVARAVAAKSGQRIDGNQEFVGQGLSNIAGAFTSGYPSSGSFNRIWVNYEAGARTPLAAVFSALFLLAIVLAVAPLTAYLPLASMAALLFVVAWGLIDVAEMRKIVRTSRGEALVLASRSSSTLVLPLEFAILRRRACVADRLPQPHDAPAPDRGDAGSRVAAAALQRCRSATAPIPRPECPQLALLRVDGSLFFGAAEHVREELDALRQASPSQRRDSADRVSGINFVDVAGAELLVRRSAALRGIGGRVVSDRPEARGSRAAWNAAAFSRASARERLFATKDDAIRTIYPTARSRDLPSVHRSHLQRVPDDAAGRLATDGAAA